LRKWDSCIREEGGLSTRRYTNYRGRPILLLTVR
jgi:hypothetical protein